MKYRITLPEPEPPNTGPDWFPQEYTVGYVEALNDGLAIRKAIKLYGPGAAIAEEVG